MNLGKWLKGKKTYIVSAGVILSTIGAYASGELSLTELIALVLNGLGLSSLRAGVKADTAGK